MNGLTFKNMILVSLIYVVLYLLGSAFLYLPGHVAVMHLAYGFAYAMLLRNRSYLWPIGVAAVLANCLIAETLIIGALKAFSTALTLWLLSWLHTQRCFGQLGINEPKNYLKLILIGAILGGSLEAAGQSMVDYWAGSFHAFTFTNNLAQNWLANGISVLLIAPLVLALTAELPQWRLRDLPQVLIWLVCMLLGQLGLFGVPWVNGFWVPNSGCLFVAVMVIALYGETRTVLFAILVFSLQLVVAAQQGQGLFQQSDADSIHASFGVTVILLSLSGTLLTLQLTQLRQRLGRLDHTVDFFKLIVENIEDFVAVLDFNGKRIYNTPSYTYFFGDVDLMRGTDCFKEIHPDDKERIKYIFNETVRTGIGCWSEYRFVLPDGSIRTMESRGGLMRPEAAEPLVVVVSRDITERKQNDMDLRIAAIAFESQEGMFVTDAQGIILRVNHAFTEISGYAAEEVIGKTSAILRSDRHDPAFYQTMMQTIASMGVWRGEVWRRRKNGEIYPEQHTLTAVKNDQGETTHFVAMLSDITERKLVEDKIKQFAFSDPLTHLANRRQLLDRLVQGIATGKREGKKMALLMLDLDHFKEVNDMLGHKAGDELLIQVAARLTARLHHVDLIARWGGDEFIVLLDDIQAQTDVARVAEDIIMDIHKPFNVGNRDDIKVGVSIGISLFPEHGNTPEMLREQADIALYKAKDNGRGCYAYFSDDLTLVTQSK